MGGTIQYIPYVVIVTFSVFYFRHDGLWAKYFDKITFGIAHWTCLQVGTAFETTDLVTTRSADTIDFAVKANDARFTFGFIGFTGANCTSFLIETTLTTQCARL
jgi:hypothetical protein